jgi:ankyrin repeat protein
METICTICKTEFSSTSNLKKHKCSAKYCLKIQGKVSLQKIEFNCVNCTKIFSSKQRLKTHRKICVQLKIDILQCKIEHLNKALKQAREKTFFVNINSIPLLILEGKHIDSVDDEGNTLLHKAVTNQKLNEIQLLVKHRADYTILNNKMQTALTLANKDIKKMILNKNVILDS